MKLALNRFWLSIAVTLVPIYVLLEAMSIETNSLFIVAEVLFLCIILGLFKIKNIYLRIGLAISLVLSSFVFVDFKMLSDGVNELVERYSQLMGLYKNNIVKDLECETFIGLETLVRMYILLVLPCVYVVYGNRFWKMVYMDVTIPFITLTLAIGRFPNAICICLLLFTYIDIVVSNTNKENSINLNDNKTEFIKHVTPITISMFILAVFLISNEIDPYVRSASLDYKKKDINDMLTGKKDFNIMSLFDWASDTANGGVSGGKLGKVDKIKFNNREILKVKVNNVDGFFDRNVYIKSYIGTNYEGDSWEVLSSKKNSQLKDICKKANCDLRDIDAIQYKLYKETLNWKLRDYDDVNVNDSLIDIESVSDSDKNCYWVEYSAIGDAIDIDVDGIRKNPHKYFKKTNYHAISMHCDKNDIINAILDLDNQISDMGKYSYLLSEYTKFVYSNYMDYPKNFDEIANEFMQSVCYQVDKYGEVEQISLYEVKQGNHFGDNGSNNSYVDLVTSSLINYYDTKFEYTLSPGKLKKGEDFVGTFLTETKRGYCTYFASAAVLLYRYMGIPARYVEGFAVSKSDFTQSDSGYECVVKDTAAHAWVEVFVNKVGWISVDVTPASYKRIINEAIENDGKEKKTEAVTTTEKETETTTKETTTNASETTTNENETTTPENTTTDSKQNSGGGDDGGTREVSDATLLNIVLIVFTMIIIAIAIIAIISICILAIRRKKYEEAVEILNGNDYRKKAVYCMNAIDYILLAAGVGYNKLATIEETAIELSGFTETTTGKPHTEVAEILYKLMYSNEDISKEDADIMLQEAISIVPYQYKKLGRIRKIYLYYFKCLYLFDK